MQFPQTVEYALRAMSQIAIEGSEGAVRARDLSETTDIPTPYLSKVLRKLVVAGLLNSQRGHRGGFTLARPAGEISFEEILIAAGYTADVERCVFGRGKCNQADPCPMHGAWVEFKGSFFDWAGRTTLELVQEKYAPVED